MVNVVLVVVVVAAGTMLKFPWDLLVPGELSREYFHLKCYIINICTIPLTERMHICNSKSIRRINREIVSCLCC